MSEPRNYITYTLDRLKEVNATSSKSTILLICPGFNGRIIRSSIHGNVQVMDNSMDIVDGIEELKNNLMWLYDYVLMYRVFEHLPIRTVDWYMYNIATIMEKNSTLEIITPDMDAIVDDLKESWSETHVKMEYVHRLNHELFSEGDNVRDRHSIWCNKYSVKRLVESEGYFKLDSVADVKLTAPIMPMELLFKFRKTC